MHAYRTHTCNDLTKEHAQQRVRLTGWVRRRRDHGGVLFLDLRDHYGVTQCVFKTLSPAFKTAETIHLESVITVTGDVTLRSKETINTNIKTGYIEVLVDELSVVNEAEYIPFSIGDEHEEPSEPHRMQYRCLDLRRTKMQSNIKMRAQVLDSMRRHMVKQGFLEIQTPILTASSPEGARDFLVPSRLHPGKFYALPQAPQIYKQLLMTAGFDKYFQIAPCFRDEDARADRAPGEFYQLDMEMSFVEQKDVILAIETMLHGVFSDVADMPFDAAPYKVLTYDEAMERYGSDKPDLRNPLVIQDATSCFAQTGFKIFATAVAQGAKIAAIVVEQQAQKPRGFFDKLNDWARTQGAQGLGYIIYDHELKGPIAKNLQPEEQKNLIETLGMKDQDAVFFVCGQDHAWVRTFAGEVRTHIAHVADLSERDALRLVWVVDFPLYEKDPKTGAIIFCHNPFSRPHCSYEEFDALDPLTVKAYQYDIVCNGVEVGSGALRNHNIDFLVKTFGVAGYKAQDVKQNFKSMLNAFAYGAPPHGGCAPGVDRIIMLLAKEENIREVIAFPKNQNAVDVLMGAPSTVSEAQLKEVFIKSVPPKIV